MPVNSQSFQRSQSSLRATVAISATILGLGGIRTHLRLLMKLMRRQRLEVVVFATDVAWDRELMQEMRSIGVRFILPPTALRSCRTLAAAYCALVWPVRLPRRASSVYCIGAGRSHLLMQRLRSRIAVTVNHEIVVPPGRESLAGTCAANLDATVANSQRVAELMKQLWPEKPIRVIPFLTSDTPAPPPVRKLGTQNNVMRVTYLGRLVAHKRPDELVRHWKKLTAERPSTVLDLYGYDPTGEMLTALTEFVRSDHLEDRVRIHGEYKVGELPKILAETDLVVLPSLDEGLPLVLVEAMSQGVPFVATAAGGTEELGEGNPDGLVTGTNWGDFAAGFKAMLRKISVGEIDPLRLHSWVENRYGHAIVSGRWLECLLKPKEFFGLS